MPYENDQAKPELVACGLSIIINWDLIYVQADLKVDKPTA